MAKVISVECWADKYFVWKLIQNESIISKDANKGKVFEFVIKKGRDNFAIGIVDKDKKSAENYMKIHFKVAEVDYEIKVDKKIEITKLKGINGYIIQLGEIKLESFFAEFLKEKGKTFSWLKDIVDLERCCKGQMKSITNNDNFQELMKYILSEYKKDTTNSIYKLRELLEYMRVENLDLTKDKLENKIAFLNN